MKMSEVPAYLANKFYIVVINRVRIAFGEQIFGDSDPQYFTGVSLTIEDAKELAAALTSLIAEHEAKVAATTGKPN